MRGKGSYVRPGGGRQAEAMSGSLAGPVNG